jgi:hypothetical protein
MTQTLAEYLTNIYLWLFFLGIPLFLTVAGSLCNWKAFIIYKMLGDRVKNIGFYRFNVILQNPYVATHFFGEEDFFESLPDDLKTSVLGARRQIRYGIASIILWIIFVLSFGAVVAHFRKLHT